MFLILGSGQVLSASPATNVQSCCWIFHPVEVQVALQILLHLIVLVYCRFVSLEKQEKAIVVFLYAY